LRVYNLPTIDQFSQTLQGDNNRTKYKAHMMAFWVLAICRAIC